MRDDHHRDALGRNAGPLEVLHHPRELFGRGPEDIAETGIDQHTIAQGVDHKQIIGELWRRAEAVLLEKRFCG
jgi:hypothetical protein